jgi:hypothetical protein
MLAISLQVAVKFHRILKETDYWHQLTAFDFLFSPHSFFPYAHFANWIMSGLMIIKKIKSFGMPSPIITPSALR